MAPPKIEIVNVSAYKISDEEGFDHCIVTFKADQTLKGFRAMAGGIHPQSGLLVGRSDETILSDNLLPSNDLFLSNYELDVGVEQIFVIYFHELQEDREYRINIYGVNSLGEWTPNEQ